MNAASFYSLPVSVLLTALAFLPRAVADEPAITDRIADGVLRVAQGDPAFETKAPGAGIIAVDPGSPAQSASDIRNFYRNSDPDHWALMLSVPGWVPAMKGDMTVKGLKANVDLGLGDIYDMLTHYLDYAVMASAEARRGRVSIFTDIVYMKLSGRFAANSTLPPLTVPGPGIKVEAKGDFKFINGIYEFGGGYRFFDRPWGGAESKKRVSMDVIAGARYYHMYTQVKINAKASVGPIAAEASTRQDATKDWVDPFIGLRMQTDLTEKLFCYLRGDVGGFGIGNGIASDFSWKAQAGLSYNPTPRMSLYGGYQVLDADYKDGGFNYNIRQMGPVIGMTYAIGGNPSAKQAAK